MWPKETMIEAEELSIFGNFFSLAALGATHAINLALYWVLPILLSVFPAQLFFFLMQKTKKLKFSKVYLLLFNTT